MALFEVAAVTGCDRGDIIHPMASGARCNRCLQQVLPLKAGNEGGILEFCTRERGASGSSDASAVLGEQIQGVQHHRTSWLLCGLAWRWIITQ